MCILIVCYSHNSYSLFLGFIFFVGRRRLLLCYNRCRDRKWFRKFDRSNFALVSYRMRMTWLVVLIVFYAQTRQCLLSCSVSDFFGLSDSLRTFFQFVIVFVIVTCDCDCDRDTGISPPS